MANLSAQERKWLAESDAETMARYQEIISDSKRKNAAVKAAQTRAAELTKRADAMKMAAGGSIKRKKK